ncbi:coiled-coil domain-containing protein 187 isoform X2 [Rhinolophus ferrumequinum]|uniref:coiled-coil domain-containing protein 187 isoform X2 n=1 Tax=Rhinolophus ferrumequinum TaxID=59479 RepID=UPI00140F84F4|nr:coiled-coil domain-containing protein 187 isoform X2 [Rhinolophus ferrumequinum]
MAALRWSRPSVQPGAPWGAPSTAWSDHIMRPGPSGKDCSYLEWTAGEEGKDGDSSVSSGRLSGSSGGHESCTQPHRPWKERPPQELGSPRQPRESNPRLEQLRDKIRAQVRWQASCASLGTSIPSSASHLYQASTPAPRKRARKLKHPPQAPAYPGLGILSAAERGAEDKAVLGQRREPSRVSQQQEAVPWEKTKKTKSGSCKREKAPKSPTPRRAAKDKGDSKKVGAAASSPVCRMPSRPASVRSDPQASANTPNLTSCKQPRSVQSAMTILRELRQQIQAGLQLAQDRQLRGGQERQSSKLWLREDSTGRRHQGPCSAPDARESFLKRPQAIAEGTHPSLERDGSFPTRQHWSTWTRWGSCPQRARSAQGRDSSFQRSGSTPERLTCFPSRPWSASAGQRTRATCENWEAPSRGPWNPLEKPSPPAQRPQSTSFTQRAGTPCKGRGSLLLPSGAKHTWPRPTHSAPQNAPRKENEARLPPPCPKLQGLLGHPYSSECLREFMRQKTLERRQRALEEKAKAVRALDLRNQRLQDIYRKQREAVLGRGIPGKAFPVVSQTNPGIVTFVPHSAQSRDLEAPGSLGSPVLQWSKVTSGMVLGDQEAPGSFCLCLNRALSHTETLGTGVPQEGWDGTPLLTSATGSLGPPKLQDPTPHAPHPGLCIYLDSEEAERLGTPGPLHFRYKQARLQALETMANILKQRIDVLTAKLLRSEAADSLGDLVLGSLPSCPSAVPVAATAAAPVCPGGLVPSRGRGAPWDWADMQAQTLLSPTCSLDGGTPLWTPSWEARRSLSSRGHLASKTRGFMDVGRLELDERLARNTASFQVLRPFTGSSRRVPAPPDPTCSSLWLEETPSARGAGLVAPWTMQSCGQQEHGRLRAGHLSDIQQKSLSFLQSLKLDQQKQEQALAHLRQRAEMEVWETQKALDEMLFKHQLQRLMEKHETQARPGIASELEQLLLCGDLDRKTSWSNVTARPRSHPPLGTDAAMPSQGAKEGWQSPVGKSASAEPMQEGRPDEAHSQLPQARLYPWDHPTQQMLEQSVEQSLQEEELRAQHQAALLRLREKALEEKMRAELAWLEHWRGCLGSTGHYTALVALVEKQQHVLSDLEREQREIQCLRNSHLLSHRERTLLLQHTWDTLFMQRSLARLQQELQAPPRLSQSPSPEIKAAREAGSEANQRPEGTTQGSSCPLTPHRPGSPWRSPESLQAPQLLTQQQDGTPPRTTSASDSHPQPPRSAWGEDTAADHGWPDARGQLVDSGSHMDPESGEQPCVPLPSPQQTAAGEADGSVPAAELQFQQTKEPPLGDPQTNPSPPSAEEETRALMESNAGSFQGPNQQSQGGGGPRSPQEASQVAEGGAGRAGAESGLDFVGSPVEKSPETESWWSGEPRTGTCWQEDAHNPFWQEAAQVMPVQTTCPAPAAAEEAAPPTQHRSSPLPQLPAPLALGSSSESAPRTCSGSSVRSRASSSASSLSFPSLQEFQKVSAVLVQLSESSVSLSDWEAGEAPDADLIWSGESSPRGSWELHQGGGWVPWERPEGSGASPLLGFSTVLGGPELALGLPQASQQPPLLHVPSPRSGSELSEASSEVWDEDDLPEPGAGAQPASGQTWPAGGSSGLENGEAPQTALPSLGPGMGQEASGTSGSLTSGSNTGKAKRTSPEAACMVSPSKVSSSSDLDLSLSIPSGSSVSEGADFGKGGETRPPQASPGRPEEPWEADLSPSTDRKPLQALPEPEVPVSLQAPPGNPSELAGLTAESRAPEHGGSGAPPVPEEDRPPLAGVLPEILSPVDEVLSYGSADLPSSTHRGALFPLPPPTLSAESGATASPHSEDFPSPPEDTMSPGGSLGPPEEDASISTGELPSSEEGLPEALSLGPQESGLCLGEGAPGGSLGDGLEESSSTAGDQAVGGPWSAPGWLGSPLCVGAGDAPVQPPPLSRTACVAGEGLPTLLTAGDTGLSGCGDPAPALHVGPCTELPGVEQATVLDLVSTQLSRRILCDTLAVLSELAQPGSSTTEGLADASPAPGPHTAATGPSRGRWDF